MNNNVPFRDVIRGILAPASLKRVLNLHIGVACQRRYPGYAYPGRYTAHSLEVGLYTANELRCLDPALA